MIEDIEVPKKLMGSFKRVVRRIPVDLKKDEELIRTVVAYLELGGEKLARQAVEAAKQTLGLEVAQRRKKAREEALIRAAEARLAAAEEESDGDDDDFDDDDDDHDDDDDDDDDLKEY
jgi:hypothetical protein